MAGLIINAAPMVIDYGTWDRSTKQLPRVPESIPQHCPKFYIFAQKGKANYPMLLVGAERDKFFGTETFNPLSKYFNHQTLFSNLVNGEGNQAMYERLIPTDAGPEANVVLYLDVLPTEVDLYERNIDGSNKLDINNDPIIIGKANGYKVKWVKEHYTTVADFENFGYETIKPGNQVDPVTGVQSQRYPILGFAATSVGSYGNNCGFRLWAPTVKSSGGQLPVKLMAEKRTYPFNISMINRTNEKTTPKTVPTVFNEAQRLVVFKENTLDPLTNSQVWIGDVAIDAYMNTKDTRYPLQFGNYDKMVAHSNNIDALVKLFHAAEVPYIDQWSDFSDAEDDAYLFNFVSGVTSQNTKYHSFQLVDDVDAIRLTENSNIYTSGSSDGTMNDTVFAELVSERVKDYMDENNELHDIAFNVESIMYDSGFPLETKLDLISFVAIRKDTFLVLSTHDVNDRVLQPSEEQSIAITLRTRAQMYPESDYFGTPVMRCMIIGRSGILRNSLYTKRIPLSAEVAIKSARYMGAANGAWKNGQHFDGAPNHVLDYMTDVSIKWVPNSVRNRHWDVGLNWVLRYDRSSFFFPALKTVYPDDTSVLNSYFTAMAICQLNKVAHSAWREFSGVSNLTNNQLVDRVNEFVRKRTMGRFDSRYVIKPKAFISDMDALRGFSWTLPIEIYSPNMKTVMTTWVEAFRLDDFPELEQERQNF